MVKLTAQDKKQLKSWGYTDDDLKQIARAIHRTVYTFKDQEITADRAVDILGRVEFLSGIARSAFHCSSVREAKDGNHDEVYFDSSRLFKWE